MSASSVAMSPVRQDPFHSRVYRDDNNGYGGGCDSESNVILFHLSVAGSVIPMRVLESDSIASVKLRIQTCKGFPVKNQKLVCKGRELTRNNSLLKDYGVKGGNVLHLVLKLSDLLLITVRTSCGEEFELHVNRNRTIGYLKQRIARKGKGLVDVDEQEIFFNGIKVDDQRLIDDLCKYNDAVIHLVVQKSAKVQANPIEKDLELSVELDESCLGSVVVEKKKIQSKGGHQIVTYNQIVKDFLLESVFVNPKVKLPPYVLDLVHSTYDGLKIGNTPIRSSEGTGGTYFMQDKLGLDYVSIFKPIDEEPMAVNNPQGLPLSTNGEGLKRGTTVGEGAVREVAAFILDHPENGPRSSSGEKMMGFAGVPPTCLVQCLHTAFNHPDGFESAPENVKVGSLQKFVKNSGSCEDMGPGGFPVEEVHKISVFDIRTANADRHAGNILIGKGEDGRTVLIPIDHGYCLPKNFEDCTFDWVYWPQSQQPYSQGTINYIKSLDAEQDIALLKYYGWDVPAECARTFRISTMLLKKGAERGLTPFTIGSIMCRETINKESLIEQMVREAMYSLLPGTSETEFMESISRVMDSWLDKLTN